MTSKHTPGPWTVEISEGELVVGQPGPDGSIVYVERYYPEDPEHRANARLIAAAPELLEALKKAEIILRLAPILGKEEACLTEVQAAIAKAEGDA